MKIIEFFFVKKIFFWTMFLKKIKKYYKKLKNSLKKKYKKNEKIKTIY